MASSIKVKEFFERFAVRIGMRRGVPMEIAINVFGSDVIEAVKKKNMPIPGWRGSNYYERWDPDQEYEDFLTADLTFFITPKHKEYITKTGLYEAVRIQGDRRYKHARKSQHCTDLSNKENMYSMEKIKR